MFFNKRKSYIPPTEDHPELFRDSLFPLKINRGTGNFIGRQTTKAVDEQSSGWDCRLVQCRGTTAVKPLVTIVLLVGVFLIGAGFFYLFLRNNPFKVKTRPNIVFILIETLRPDHLGCYGYPRDTSPNIDRIARQGILFSNFYSVSSWTNPTIISLFTGLYPQSVLPAAKHMDAVEQILPDMPTLAKILAQSGYRTVAIIDHPGINEKLQYDQGFDIFKEVWHDPGWQEDWGGVAPEVFLENVAGEIYRHSVTNSPFFLFLHVIYPHEPYRPPSPYDALFGPGYRMTSPDERAGMINAYDGEIRYADDLVGRIFDLLGEKRFLDKTYIIITSDHGEGFYEHGLREHGNSLYNELLHVPLVIYPPGGRRRESKQVSFLSSCIDLFPTILDFAGIKEGLPVDGESLTRFLRPQNKKISVATIFSESCHSVCVESFAMQNTRYKFILHPDKDFEVYDKFLDSMETKNIASDLSTLSLEVMANRTLQHKILNKERRKIHTIQKTQLQKEAIDKIKSLGYVQ